MLYRISLRARNEVANWEHFMTADFDTSGTGQSALVAAAYRGLEAEVYRYTEEQVIGVFHDFDKFFDSIDTTILINKALEVNFPIIDLLMTMLQHTAPRIIQFGGFCSRSIITHTSILAGCKHSIALTRVLFLTGIHNLCVQHPLAAPKLYVDVTAMLTAGENEQATQDMWLSILDFVNLSQALGLKLSTKGVIVAKQPSAARALVKTLAQKRHYIQYF